MSHIFSLVTPSSGQCLASFFIPFVLGRCQLAGPNGLAKLPRDVEDPPSFHALAFGFGVRLENVRILANLGSLTTGATWRLFNVGCTQAADCRLLKKSQQDDAGELCR